jgi:hypothetical protein
MPLAAPDDPAAYRGVRFEMNAFRPVWPSVEAGGRAVPWLRMVPAGYTSAGGDLQVFDGRRWMVWFFRLLENPAVSPYPPMAVLDVLVLPGEPREDARPPISRGCGPDGDVVIVLGEDGWRLNDSTGRIGPFDPDDLCRGD